MINFNEFQTINESFLENLHVVKIFLYNFFVCFVLIYGELPFIFQLIPGLFHTMNYLSDHLFTRSIGDSTLLFVVVVNVRSYSSQKLIQRAFCRFPLAEIGIFTVVLDLDIVAESLIVLMHFNKQVCRELR